MIIRIVKMEFKPEALGDFAAIFEESREKIRQFEGCHFLELLRDVENESVLTTYSIWESEADLENYRQSALFQMTWAQVKPLFAAKPVANSYETLLRMM
jgi:quinol monooxygenase YgiN